MRLWEITGQKLYLGSETKKQLGGTYIQGGEPKLLSDELEQILEQRRPGDCVSRQKCVWVLDKPAGADWVYLVHATGSLDRKHTGWLKMMREADRLQKGVVYSYADRYWRGIACPDERMEPWELRASEVSIVTRVGDSEASFGHDR